MQDFTPGNKEGGEEKEENSEMFSCLVNSEM